MVAVVAVKLVSALEVVQVPVLVLMQEQRQALASRSYRYLRS